LRTDDAALEEQRAVLVPCCRSKKSEARKRCLRGACFLDRDLEAARRAGLRAVKIPSDGDLREAICELIRPER
jgi:hypothetical protein